MDIKGTIIYASNEISGVSQSGNNWKKREYVLENTDGQYPRKVAFTCFGDNADRIQLKVGDQVDMFFDIDSRQYKERWYTDIRCYRCDVIQAAGAPNPAPAAAPAMPAPTEEEFPF